MSVSILAAHSKYLAENPGQVVSLSSFANLRPKNVHKLTPKQREFCCCVYCMNICYNFLTLSRALVTKVKKKNNERDIFEILLCKKADSARFHARSCIDGSCRKCSDYLKTLIDYYSEISSKKLLTWCRWEKQKDKDNKIVRVLKTKTGYKKELLQEFVNEDIKKPVQGTSFLHHLHVALWQCMQFSKLKTNLPEDSVLQVMDFAKNREIRYQDEIKAVFYTNNQVTIHPIVTYYRLGNGTVR